MGVLRICFQCKCQVVDIGVDPEGKVQSVSCPNQNCIRHGLVAIGWLDAEVAEKTNQEAPAPETQKSDPASPGEVTTV